MSTKLVYLDENPCYGVNADNILFISKSRNLTQSNSFIGGNCSFYFYDEITLINVKIKGDLIAHYEKKPHCKLLVDQKTEIAGTIIGFLSVDFIDDNNIGAGF